MTEREYTTSETDNDYLFTGKERDSEKSGYDYFGARYLNSRIGRWSSIDPLMEKHMDFTPYNYVLNNNMGLIDPDGRQVNAQSANFFDPSKSDESYALPIIITPAISIGGVYAFAAITGIFRT